MTRLALFRASPGPTPRRPNDEVAKDVSNLIEKIQEPEAEIALVAGESKVIQTKRTLTLGGRQPAGRRRGVAGRSAGSAAPERHR